MMSEQDLHNLGQSKHICLKLPVSSSLNTVEHTFSDTFAVGAPCQDSRGFLKPTNQPTHSAKKNIRKG